MKVYEFKNIVDKNGLEVDVVDDYTGELEVCYVGDSETKLTEEGKDKFMMVLDMDVEWDGGDVAVLKVNKYTEGMDEEMLSLASKFFYGLAGYMGVKEYEKYFVEEYE